MKGCSRWKPAAVELLDEASDSRRYGTATGAGGRFVFGSVTPGRYWLVVTYLGYKTHRELVTVDVDEDSELRVLLAAKAVESPEVVVTAGRARERITSYYLHQCHGTRTRSEVFHERPTGTSG